MEILETFTYSNLKGLHWLHANVNRGAYDYDELLTILIKVEMVINSGPLLIIYLRPRPG